MKPFSLTFLTFVMMLVSFSNAAHSQHLVTTEDLHIRDPFVVTDKKNNRYLLYKSQSVKLTNGKTVGGVAAYESTDLKNWKGPIQVLQIPEENTLNGGIWAPEVHEYKGNYYIFATINTDKTWKEQKPEWPPYQYRSVQIFKADNPLGPFKSFSKDPHLDMKEMTLDGTLWVEKGTPYMIYCHEWVQINDGTMELIALEKDLSKTKGKSKTLFKASEAKWSTGTLHKDQVKSYVTDGCYVYKSKTGDLLMIWSSFMNGNYAVGVARSTTGRIHGPWKQEDKPIFEKNGGHGMIFKDLIGNLFLVLHGPNSPGGKERAQFFPIQDLGNTLQIK